MNLLIDGRCLLTRPASGVTHLVQNLLPALFSAYTQDTITLFTSSWRPPTDLQIGLLPSHVRHIHRKIPSKIDNLAYFAGLQTLEKNVPPQDHLFFPTIDFTGKLTVPYSILVHDLSFLVEPRWFSLKSRWWHRLVGAQQLISGAKNVFTVSNYSEKELIRLLSINPDRIHVIPVGTIMHPSARVPSPVEQPYLLGLAGHDDRKNIAVAIEAWKIVRRQHPELKLVITTHEEKPSHESGLVFLRYPSCQVLQSLISQAAMLLYPSWYEGFGLPLHEAAALGTPSIASLTTALSETAPSGTRFAPPAKPQLWAMMIEETLRDGQIHPYHPRSWQGAAEMIQKKIRTV